LHIENLHLTKRNFAFSPEDSKEKPPEAEYSGNKHRMDDKQTHRLQQQAVQRCTL
jgi:hypothetical protein